MKFQSRDVIKGKQVETWFAIPTQAALCLGYAPEAQIYRCLEWFKAEKFSGQKLLMDLGFPGNRLLKFEGWETVRVKNQGTAKNWMVGWRILKCPDKVVGVEPDELPSLGWVRAALAVLRDPTIGYVACTMTSHHPKYIEHFQTPIFDINGVSCVEFPIGSPTPWPCGVFHARLLKHGMECNEFYGALEPIMQEKAYKLGLRTLHMIDYSVQHLTGSMVYETWKALSADNATKKSFEEWLPQKQIQP